MAILGIWLFFVLYMMVFSANSVAPFHVKFLIVISFPLIFVLSVIAVVRVIWTVITYTENGTLKKAYFIGKHDGWRIEKTNEIYEYLQKTLKKK